MERQYEMRFCRDCGLPAGRVAGLFEAWSGSRAQVTWAEDRRGRLKVTMGRTVDGR